MKVMIICPECKRKGKLEHGGIAWEENTNMQKVIDMLGKMHYKAERERAAGDYWKGYKRAVDEIRDEILQHRQ